MTPLRIYWNTHVFFLQILSHHTFNSLTYFLFKSFALECLQWYLHKPYTIVNQFRGRNRIPGSNKKSYHSSTLA